MQNKAVTKKDVQPNMQKTFVKEETVAGQERGIERERDRERERKGKSKHIYPCSFKALRTLDGLSGSVSPPP